MIEISGIKKRYKQKEVLNGVAFHADSASCVGIVGSNGCGKTTLLSILSGILKADAGSIRYFDEEMNHAPGLFTKYVAYVPQENPLMEELSVWDNLRLWYQGNKRKLEQDLEQGPAGMLGLKEVLNVSAGKLSGGMKKRLSIACSLSNHAPILIMDEPGAALDLFCKEEIRMYLMDYKKNGGIVILTSHELAELDLCDSMFALKQGLLKKIPVGLSAKELIEQLK